MADLISRNALINALRANTMSNGTLINTNTMLAILEKFPSAPEHNYENCHNATCRSKCRTEGYNKAIDEFVKRIIEQCEITGMNKTRIELIAKELKSNK